MSRPRGFSFLELVSAGAIIAILAAIAIPNFLHAKIRAQVAAAHEELATVTVALQAYWDDHRDYPPTLPVEFRMPGSDRIRKISVSTCLLTTPVPYITLLPDDIFTEEIRRIPYGYVNLSRDDGPILIHDRDWDRWARHVVYSLGPDRQMNWPYAYDFIGDPTGAPMLHFDPANGITSHGDIFFFGPN